MKTKNSRFPVNPYKNSWRVYGRRHNVDGTVTVIRENFAEQERALARRYELEVAEMNDRGQIEARAQAERRLMPIPTRLSLDYVRRVEVAKGLLGDHDPIFVAQHFLRTWKPSTIQKTLEEAVQEFIAAKTAKKLRDASIRNLNGRTRGLLKAHGAALVGEVTSAHV